MKSIIDRKKNPFCKRCGKMKDRSCRTSHWCQKCNRLIRWEAETIYKQDKFREIPGNDYY